jgi:nitroreductase
MDFRELMLQRQSVRRFDASQKIAEDDMQKILEAGRMAPSACNSQPWTFVLVDEQPLLSQVAQATQSKVIQLNTFVKDAAALIVIVIEKPRIVTQIGGAIKRKDYPQYDIGFATAQMSLQATELSLGSCILGWFDEKKIKQLLQIPGNRSIGLVLALGYAVEDYKQRQKIRKAPEMVFRRNGYGV